MLVGLLPISDWMTRMSTVFALGLIGDPVALAPVLQARRRDRLHWRYLLMREAYGNTVRALEEAAGRS